MNASLGHENRFAGIHQDGPAGLMADGVCFGCGSQ